MKIRLQGTGWHDAIPVYQLKIGDIIEWNFGYTSEVINLTPTKTGKQITVTLKNNDTGNINNRRMGANRLVAIMNVNKEVK